MKIILFTLLFHLFTFFSNGESILDIDKIIKFLKDSNVIPDFTPNILSDAIVVIPPYLIYKYKNKVYHLHNDVNITSEKNPVSGKPELQTNIPIEDMPQNVPEIPAGEIEKEPEKSKVVEIDGKVTPSDKVVVQPVPEIEEPVDIDEETGIGIPQKEVFEGDEEIERDRKKRNEFNLPEVVEPSEEEKTKNITVQLYYKGANYKLKDIIQYKENEQIFKELEKGYALFYKNSTKVEQRANTYNVEVNDYYSFLKAIHILFKESNEKYYTINNIPKEDFIFFLKHLYINIYNSLKDYIFFIGYNFDDYVYSVENFSLNKLLNDYFFLTNSDYRENGSFENIIKNIKYAPDAKDQISLKKIEESIKVFLRFNDLKVLDLKLLHNLFSRNCLLNYTENDLIKYATDIVNITQVNISPRIVSTLLRYFLEKMNIILMPLYPTQSTHNYRLFIENNDLLMTVEIIYRKFLGMFYTDKLIKNIIKPDDNAYVYKLTPWINKVYFSFNSTYDFLSLKYGIVIFNASFHMFRNYFGSFSKIRDVVKEHIHKLKIDTFDKFLNEFLNLFEIEKTSAPASASAVPIVGTIEKTVERRLSELQAHDEPEEKTEEEELLKKIKRKEELRNKIELELEAERKKKLQEIVEKKEKAELEEQQLIEKRETEAEAEFKKLEEEEEEAEVIQDAAFDKEYEEDYASELEFAEGRRGTGFDDGAPDFLKTALAQREPDSFYYNHSKEFLKKKIEEIYNTHVNSGYKFISDLGSLMEDLFYELGETLYPDFDEVQEEVIQECNRVFEELINKIKDKEKQKDIDTYKSELESDLNGIQKKNEEKYAIIESLFTEKVDKYKEDTKELCTQRFHGNFRKNLGKKKMKMLEEFRYYYRYSLRFVKDLTKVEEPEYTRVLTDIYTTNRKIFKDKYATSRRLIAKSLDSAYYEELDKHFKKVGAIVETHVQEVRKHVVTKIDRIIKELYNETYVELRIERLRLNEEKKKIITKYNKLIEDDKKLPEDLKEIEAKLSGLPSDAPDKAANEEKLNKEIADLKETIETNKKELPKCRSDFKIISEELDKITKKMDIIHELNGSFKLFKYDIIKQYKVSKGETEVFIVNSDKVSDIYRSIEKIIKDSILTLDELKFQQEDLKKKIEILQDKKEDVSLDIEIREILFKDATDGENTAKYELRKQELESLIAEINTIKEKLEESEVKKEIILDEFHYLTRDSITEIPKSLNVLLPVEADHTENAPFEDFLTSLKAELGVENDAFRRLVITFDDHIHDYDDDLIFVYDFLKISHEESNMNEKMYAQYRKFLNIYIEKVTGFHNDFKKYLDLRKKTEKEETDKDTLTYLERNNIHIGDFLEKLRKGIHVPDLSYIITNNDIFTKQIKNDKPELLEAYTPLVAKYKELEKEGISINENFDDLILYENNFKLDLDKIAWYKGILKKYIQRSKDLYKKSYEHNELSALDVTSFLDKKVQEYLKKPILLQYGGDVWGEPPEKRHLRVIEDERKFPYILKEIKDEYVLDKIINTNLKKTNKLNDIKEYINVKLYNIIEEKNKKLYLFDKNEIDKLKLLTPDGKLIQGSFKNFLTHVKMENINFQEKTILDSIMNQLKDTQISYDYIIEVIKYLKENQKIIHIRDLMSISEVILELSNVYYIKTETIAVYFLAILELLGIEIRTSDIKEKDLKSRMLVYLNVLRTYHFEKLRIRDEIKDYVIKFLVPQKEFKVLQYGSQLHDFILAINESLDGNTQLYEVFKKKNEEFHSKIIYAIKKGVEDFMIHVITTIIKDNPQMKEEEYFDDNYNNEERDRFKYSNYVWKRVSINEVLSLYFYVVNPGLRVLLHNYFIKADIDCWKDYTNFDFKQILFFLNSEKINENFKAYMKSLDFFEIPPLVILLRFFFDEKFKHLFKFDKIKELVKHYFSAQIFNENTKLMIAKLVYSFFVRLNYHTVTYFDNDLIKIIDNSDIEILTLFHNILNKMNYILYCKNEKLYLERYAPTNVLSNKVFKLDAVKIFHEFLYTLPEYIKRPLVNFFETDFISTATSLLYDFFKYVQTFLDIGSKRESFESEEANKIETFFKINYAFTKNKNIIEETYEKLIENKPYFKDMPILYSRKIKYDHANEKFIYQTDLELKDIVDEKSFKLLIEIIFKEHYTFSDLNITFAEFMKKNSFIFPKFDILKKKIISSGNEKFYLNLYKYMYDKFQLLNIPQPIHELFYLFVKKLLDYSLLPKKLVDDELQEAFNTELQNKYLKYFNFLEKLFKCLFNFYNYDESYHCESFGFFTDEDITLEQKVFKLMQTAYIDITEPIKHNPIHEEYKVENEQLNLQFLKQFIPSSDTMEKEELEAEIFKLKYFVSEIIKFILRTVLSKVSPNYLIYMKHDELNLDIDNILSNIHSYFNEVRKVKEPDASEVPSVPNAIGSINNLSTNDDGEVKFENIKYYFNNYLIEYLLKNNMIFGHFGEFLQNIHKFKQYFPSLSELYLFVDKRVNIINSLHNPYYTKMANTQSIIRICIDTFKSFGLQLYEL